MGNLKKIVMLIYAPIILNFYCVSNCFSMTQPHCPPGGPPLEGSPLLAHGQGAAPAADVKLSVRAADSHAELEYQLPVGVSHQDHFRNLLIGSVLGVDQDTRTRNKSDLELLLVACLAQSIALESRADFLSIGRSRWCRRTRVGPVRFAAEHQDSQLVALLLNYGLAWLETDGLFGDASIFVPDEYARLQHSDGYNRAVTYYNQRCKKRACTCIFVSVVTTIVGCIIASTQGAF